MTDIRQNLYGETALIRWCELQRFFAQGNVLQVVDTENLLDIAVHFAQDDVGAIQTYVDQEALIAVSNEQAKKWVSENAEVWSVVVAPFVLVQNFSGEITHV